MAQEATILLAYWQHQHEKTIGHPYMPQYGKDMTILKGIIKVYGMQRTKKMIDAFFGMLTTEPFLQKCGATIGIFKSQISKIILSMIKDDTKEDNEGKGKL